MLRSVPYPYGRPRASERMMCSAGVGSHGLSATDRRECVVFANRSDVFQLPAGNFPTVRHRA